MGYKDIEELKTQRYKGKYFKKQGQQMKLK